MTTLCDQRNPVQSTMPIPSLDDARRLATQGNLIPVYAEILADMETPVSAFRKIAYDESGRRLPHAFLLESVEGGERIGRYSFLGAGPAAVLKRGETGSEVTWPCGRRESLSPAPEAFADVQLFLARWKQVPVPGLAPFAGGAVGYTAYETVQRIEPVVKCQRADGLDTPEAIFLIAHTLVAFDRVRHRIQVISHADLSGGASVEEAYAAACGRIEAILAQLARPLPHLTAPALDNLEPHAHVSNLDKPRFLGMVAKAQEYIRAGDVIQVVLSQRFKAAAKPEPLSLFRAIRAINPSPYMFCLHLGDDFALAGGSPEVHAKVSREGVVTVRPIAGTRRRGADATEDAALEAELLADGKEIAEHVMLVDLARNDIGRIAETGSVRVTQKMVVERYSHVMHIVSEVQGQLLPELSPAAAMASTFPAGTVSGAPKIRAMQIIAELEPTARGPYAGAVCYFSFSGGVDSCIAIRTAVLKGEHTYIQAGAGIVADSVPEAEYEETRAKARAMLVALAAATRIPN
ncbi:MAG: Anthranilate synthase component 1 [Verrucomicrobiota bacterium]